LREPGRVADEVAVDPYLCRAMSVPAALQPQWRRRVEVGDGRVEGTVHHQLDARPVVHESEQELDRVVTQDHPPERLAGDARRKGHLEADVGTDDVAEQARLEGVAEPVAAADRKAAILRRR